MISLFLYATFVIKTVCLFPLAPTGIQMKTGSASWFVIVFRRGARNGVCLVGQIKKHKVLRCLFFGSGCSESASFTSKVSRKRQRVFYFSFFLGVNGSGLRFSCRKDYVKNVVLYH
jgi:hypothetical protein